MHKLHDSPTLAHDTEQLRHVLRVGELSRQKLCALFDLTDYVRSVGVRQFGTPLAGKQLVTAFFEPSTRTRLSFESAMLRLGGSCHGFTDLQQSRMAGTSAESIVDTARMLGMYGDARVVRHPQTGYVDIMADHSGVPTINGGDGTGEHPTQAMIDLYTVCGLIGGLDGVRILFLNDLRMRCVRSLAAGIGLFGGQVHLLRSDCDGQDTRWLQDIGDATVVWHDDLGEAIRTVDAVYVSPTVHQVDGNVVKPHRTAQALLAHMGHQRSSRLPLILHPLPRGAELPTSLDELPQSAYFIQAAHAVALRMALLLLMFPQ
jgi:aspartate carbamoyltransferase catalytic subunit